MANQRRPTLQFIHKFVEKTLEVIKDFDWLCVGLYPSTYRDTNRVYEMVVSHKGTKINSINDIKVLPKCNLREVYLCITATSKISLQDYHGRLYDTKVILSFYISSSEVNEDSYASLEETILQAIIDHTFS